MQCTSRVVLFLGAVAWASTAWAKLTPEQVRQLPPPATRTVDFRKDIQPILEASCIKCHARGKSKGGFLMDTRETAMRDSDSGPSIVVGNSADSLLIELVSGLNTENLMPQKGSKLTLEQVGLLRAWIDQGMKWDPAVTFAKPAPRNLEPRQVSLPDGVSGNPVDRFIADYFKAHGKNPPARIDDRAFIRRVSLDAIGVIPEPDVVEAFVRDASPDKRSRLVERLLADKHRYAQHWLTFWNDLLRNDYRGTGYIDGGRKQITGWLYTALRDNKPYDHFVRELINPSAESEGFIKGIVWRGAVNASMVPPMQAAQNISQIFMGVNLKCASCHDSFIDDWQLSDSYGLAGIYADGPMEMVQCDKPTGRTAPLKFLFPELGGIDAAAPKTQRLQQLSGLITSPKNGRLSRTVVNRLWARFLGRGLVEPLDVMQNEAWLPPLLDWLAEDLVAHQWDLKRTMALILTSGAYQMPAVDSPEKDGKPLPDFAFAGPVIRRLSAEQFRDALSVVTGVWAEKPDGNLHTELSAGVEAPALSASAFWIWNDTHAANGVAPGAVQFRREFSVPSTGLTEAVLWLSVDNEAKVFVNGQSATLSGRAGPGELARVDLLALLKVGGTNVLAIEAVNGGADRNPAGLLAYAKLRAGGTVLDFGSDAAWAVASGAGEFWKLGDFGNSRWAKAAVLGEPGMQPWPASRLLPAAVAELGGFAREFRSSLLAADPLTTALGRPNREQVNTVRAQTATTLQALELTNGSTLARLLRTGAEKLSSRYADNPELARRVFEAALSRPPTPAETRLAVDLLTSGTRTDAVEDLLWSVAMLPEFQLIL